MACLVFCNDSMRTSRTSASFSNPLAGGIMGILLMNERKIGKEEERKKDIFLLEPLQEDAAVPFNGLNMQV